MSACRKSSQELPGPNSRESTGSSNLAWTSRVTTSILPPGSVVAVNNCGEMLVETEEEEEAAGAEVLWTAGEDEDAAEVPLTEEEESAALTVLLLTDEAAAASTAQARCQNMSKPHSGGRSNAFFDLLFF